MNLKPSGTSSLMIAARRKSIAFVSVKPQIAPKRMTSLVSRDSSECKPQVKRTPFMLPALRKMPKSALNKGGDQRTMPVLKKNESGEYIREQEITVTVISNYGNTSEISCNEIDFLTFKREKVEITEMLFNDRKEGAEDMQYLVDDNMDIDEREMSTLWTRKWPPQMPMKTYTLTFIAKSNEKICYCRVWPNTHCPDKNIKTAVITIDGDIVFHGDFPYDFGRVLELFKIFNIEGNKDMEAVVHNLTISKYKPDYAWFHPRTIKIVPLESYNADLRFGFNHIMVFDHEGKQIPENNMIIQVEDAADNSDINKLMRPIPNRYQAFTFDSEFYVAGSIHPGSNRGILLAFPQKTYIGCIAITNPNAAFNERVFGTKIVEILFEGRKQWIGRIKRNKFPIEQEKGSNSSVVSTFAWFIENKEYQQQVLSKFPVQLNEVGIDSFE